MCKSTSYNIRMCSNGLWRLVYHKSVASYCHCNGSVDKILYQSISSSWSIQLIENWSTSCYPVPVSQLDFTSASIDQSQTNNEVEQFWRKLTNFLSNEFGNLGNELIQYFINASIATTVKGDYQNLSSTGLLQVVSSLKITSCATRLILTDLLC